MSQLHRSAPHLGTPQDQCSCTPPGEYPVGPPRRGVPGGAHPEGSTCWGLPGGYTWWGLPGGVAWALALTPLVLVGMQVKLRTAATRLATRATKAGH